MNRRLAISALSAAALVPVASRVARAQAPMGAIMGMDGDYVMMTAMGGSTSRLASQMALSRATNPSVRQFAGFEDAEQNTVAQVLADYAPPPTALDGFHARMIQALESVPAGAFDRAYVQMQVSAHQELLNAQQTYLASGQSRDLRHIAMLNTTAINMHLAMLQGLATLA